MNIRIFFIITVIIFSGCATTKGFHQMMSTWNGKPEADLIRVWGTPINVYETGISKFLTYESARNVFFPGTAPTYTANTIGNTTYINRSSGIPAYNISKRCRVTFEIIDGVVSSWTYKGNDCKAVPN